MNKNDNAWEKLFEKYSILETIDYSGQFIITAEQINEFRESRLMTKFDHKTNLPHLFSDYGLNILPLTRGSYVIGKFKAYHDIKYNHSKPKLVQFPSHLQSINYSNIYSESAALNCAFVTEILSDIAGEKVLPTVSGRMSTSVFEFEISGDNKDYKFNVANSQCEIDGGYEGESVLLLVEAKNYTVNDFLIRQLYYPYRLWASKISKKTIPVFLSFSNDTFSFFKYSFTKLTDYNSLQLIEQKNYIITSQQVTLKDIQKLLSEVSIKPDEQGIPFPQADYFERVIDLLGLLYNADNGFLERDFITSNYDFNKRQTAYYQAAARYLNLASSNKGNYSITEHGRKIMAMSYYEKNLALVRCIISHEVFNKGLKLYFTQLYPLTREQVVSIMKDSIIYDIESDVTYYRRAQTVIKWIEWIIQLED